MAAAPYILARTFQEAHSFAREVLGLQHGQYRVVTSSGTVKSLRNVDLYLAPGWNRRFDRFQMASALKWTRMNVIEPGRDEAEEPVVTEPETGTKTEVDPGLMAAFEAFLADGGNSPEFQAIVEHGLDDEIVSSEQIDDEIEQAIADAKEETEQVPAPAEEQPSRRRRRCKECGILVDPDEVDEHAAEHTTNGD